MAVQMPRNYGAAAQPLRHLAPQPQPTPNGEPQIDVSQLLYQPKVNDQQQINFQTPGAPVARPCELSLEGPIPGVKYYHDGSLPAATIRQKFRLHPAQCENLPPSIINAIGNLQGKEVDYFFTVSSGEILKQAMEKNGQPLRHNFLAHPWVFPDYRKDENQITTVNMGIFEAQNVMPVRAEDGIGFNCLKPSQVHAHPVRAGNQNITATSPNNAHFLVDPNAPFSSFWSVCQLGNRIVITKHLLIHEYDFMTKPIFDAFREGIHFADIFNRLHANPYEAALEQLAQAFEQNRPDAMQRFNEFAIASQRALGRTHHQNGIYRQAWLDLWHQSHPDQPAPHADFGKAAFHSSGDLDRSFHCDGAKKAAIIRNYKKHLTHEYQKLISGMQSLFQISGQALPVSDQRQQAVQLASNWRETRLSSGNGNLICPGYQAALYNHAIKMERFPHVGFYNVASQEQAYLIAPSHFLIRLHSAQHGNLPQSVKNAIGDTRNKKVDYLFSCSSGVEIKRSKEALNQSLKYNLSTHAWAHPHYQHGQDRTETVNIGLFEGQNVSEASDAEGIGFNRLKPISVHCHPSPGITHALSPNNAHFMVDSGAPYSTFWSVCQLGDRMIVTKHLLINEFDVVTQSIVRAFERGQSVNQILQNLQQNANFSAHFEDLARALEDERPGAQKLFQDFTGRQHHQNGIYKQTWLEKWAKNHPHQEPPHGLAFGKMSFQSSPYLEPQYRCTPHERAQIIRAYSAQVSSDYNRVVQDLQTLFSAPREIPPQTELQKEKLRLLMPVVDAFKRGDENEGMRLFNTLPQVHKGGVCQYAWEFAGCPQDFPGDFGAAAFYRDTRLSQAKHCDREQRIKAILCYIHSI